MKSKPELVRQFIIDSMSHADKLEENRIAPSLIGYQKCGKVVFTALCEPLSIDGAHIQPWVEASKPTFDAFKKANPKKDYNHFLTLCKDQGLFGDLTEEPQLLKKEA